MSKSLAASQQLMKNYLSELLTEEDKVFQEATKPTKEKPLTGKKLEKLLQDVNVTQKEPAIISKKQQPLETNPVSKPVVESTPEPALVTQKSQRVVKTKTLPQYREGSFQAMFFEVAGLTIAVPLIELGGIYNVDKTNALVGKPEWIKGVMIHRDEQVNVVDTALWVMPEKCDEKLKSSLAYKYVIMLSTSKWGLLAEKLVDTVTLEQEDVKWLDDSRKRPWLAGLVKDRMCALVEVDAFIRLLNDGMNVNQK